MTIKSAFFAPVAALMLPCLALAGTQAPIATFEVDYHANHDSNPVFTTVYIECTGGNPIQEDISLNIDSSNIIFVVEFPEAGDGSIDCQVWSDDVANYTTHYECDSESSTGSVECTHTDEGCFFTNAQNGSRYDHCDIYIDPNPATLEVFKTWNAIGNGGQANLETINYDAMLQVCSEKGVIEDAVPNRFGNWCVNKIVEGPGIDSLVVTMNTHWEGNRITIFERSLDSSVETDMNDCISYDVFPGDERECTVINTVFYEGIPTLNQYGLAIMALLMLGVGFVGFRRFV